MNWDFEEKITVTLKFYFGTFFIFFVFKKSKFLQNTVSVINTAIVIHVILSY